MKKPILLISTALFLAGCDAAPSEPTVSDAPPIEVTSVALGKAFADNEVAAQTKFGGKTLVVSGKIKAITLDFSDKPVIQLPGQNEFSDVQVSLTDEFAKKAGELKKGQNIVVTCSELTEVIGSPMLDSRAF